MITIKSSVRGGGSGRGAWIAKIVGTHPIYKLDRQFVEKKSHLSRSGRSGLYSWDLTEPGLYELRGLQYEKDRASIGTLDSGYLVLAEDGTTSRVTLDEAIAIARQMDEAKTSGSEGDAQ